MALYAYAVLRLPLAAPLRALRGARGRAPLRIVEADGLGLAVRAAAAAPAPGVGALRRHDAVVRRLAAAAPAVLPVRFGALLPDEAAARDWLASSRPALAAALRLVAGREQMMARLAWHGAAVEPEAPGDPAGPGARYLAARRRAAGWGGLPAPLLAFRDAVAPLAAAERVERHATPPLVATVYHLVARGAAAAYRDAAAGCRPRLGAGTVTVSGPWPAYAFTPDALP